METVSKVAAARQALAAKPGGLEWLLERDRRIARHIGAQRAEALMRQALGYKPQPRDCSLIDIRDNIPPEAAYLPYRAPYADMRGKGRRVDNRVFAGCKH